MKTRQRGLFEAGEFRIVVSHPLRKKRAMDGAPGSAGCLIKEGKLPVAQGTDTSVEHRASGVAGSNPVFGN